MYCLKKVNFYQMNNNKKNNFIDCFYNISDKKIKIIM